MKTGWKYRKWVNEYEIKENETTSESKRQDVNKVWNMKGNLISRGGIYYIIILQEIEAKMHKEYINKII